MVVDSTNNMLGQIKNDKVMVRFRPGISVTDM